MMALWIHFTPAINTASRDKNGKHFHYASCDGAIFASAAPPATLSAPSGEDVT